MWGNCLLTSDCVRGIEYRDVSEGCVEIVCWQRIVLGGLGKVWEGKGLGELCVEGRLC